MTRVAPIFEPIDVTSSMFEQLGGECRVRGPVDRFYELMDMQDEFAQRRAVQGKNWDLARHWPFSIGKVERDQWFACTGRPMRDKEVLMPLFQRLLYSFFGVADWMRNRAE
jgi:hemoglobin